MLREQARMERAMAAKATDRPAGDLALRQQPLFDPPVKGRGGGDKVHQVLGRFDDMKSIMLENQYDFLGVQQQPDTPAAASRKHSFTPIPSSSSTKPMMTPVSCEFKQSTMRLNSNLTTNSGGSSGSSMRPVAAVPEGHVRGSGERHPASSSGPNSGPMRTSTLPSPANTASSEGRRREEQQIHFAARHSGTTPNRDADSAKQQRQQQHVDNLKSASSKPIPGALKVTMPAAEPEEEEKRAMATLNLSRTSIDSIEDVFKEMDLPVSPITALPSHSPHKDSSFFPPHKSMTKPPSAKPTSYEPASILDDLSLSSTDSSDSDDDVPPVTKASAAMKSPVATSVSVKTSSPLAIHTSQSLSSSSSSASKPLLSFSKALPLTTKSEVPLTVKANDTDNKTGSSSRTLTNKAPSLHLNIPAASTAAHADIAATSKSPLAGVMRSQPSVTFKTVSPSVVSTSVASTSIVSATTMSSSPPHTSSRIATKPTPALAPAKSTSKVSITKKPNRSLSDSSGSSSSSDSDSDNDNDSIATDPGDAETAESTAVSHPPSPVPVQPCKESVGEEEAPVAEDTSAKDRNWSLGTWLQAANPVVASSKFATETKLSAGDETLKSKSTKTVVKESPMKESQKMKAKEQDARKDDKTPTKAQLKSGSTDRSAEKSKKSVAAVDERSSEKTKKSSAIADLLSADKAKKNTSTANEYSNDTNKKSSSKSVVEDLTNSRHRSTSQSDAEVRPTPKKQDLKSSSSVRTSKDCKDGKDQSENQAKKNTGTKVSEVSKKDKVSNETKTGEKRPHEMPPKPKKPESLNKQCSKEENIRQTLRENKTQSSVKRRKHSASYKSSEFISSDDSDDDMEPSTKHRKDTQTQRTKKSDSMSTVAATDSGLSLELPASVGVATSQKCLEDNNEEDTEPALKPVFHPKVGVSYENGRPEILVSIDLTRFQDILGSVPHGLTYDGLLAAASFDDGPPAKRPAMHDLRVAVVGPYKHSTALALSSSSDDIQLSHDARFAERLLPGIGGSVPLSPAAARMGDAGVAAPVNAAAAAANNVVRFKMAAAEEVRTQVFPDVEPANLMSSRIQHKSDVVFDASDIAIAGGSGGMRMVDSGVEWASSSGDGHRWQVAAAPSGVDRTSYAPHKSAAMSFSTDNSGGASQGSQRGGSSQWTGKILPPPTGGASQRPPAAAGKNGAEQNNSIEALLQLITRNIPEAADKCLQQATALKHEADKTSDGLLKQLKYTEAVVCFVLCGRAMENDSLSLAEPSKIFKMYDDTLRFVRNLVGHRTVNDNQADTGDTAVARQLDREAKLVTLSYRLQALLYFRLYNIRRSETVKLKKVIDDYNKGSKSSASRGAAVSLPSPSSPQPSPAGSVASVGSTGSAGDVRQASGGGVTVPSRIHSVTQQYIGHIHHLQQAHELWDQACMLATSPPHAAFFEELDRACGALTLHSGMTQLVRYVHAGLRRLKDMA